MNVSEPDTLSRMQAQLRLWQQTEDPRSVFLDCYSRMTSNMLSNVNAGRFEDPHWVSGLLHLFAEYYFNALACFQSHSPSCPTVWRQAHEATLSRDLHVMQALLLGVNAHINYDLVFCLHDCLTSDWDAMGRAQREARSRDHLMVNEVIGETIDEVQDEVIEQRAPYMDLIDRLAGRWDERFLKYLISHWRGHVWDNAIALVEATNETEKALVAGRVTERASEIARWVMVF